MTFNDSFAVWHAMWNLIWREASKKKGKVLLCVLLNVSATAVRTVKASYLARHFSNTEVGNTTVIMQLLRKWKCTPFWSDTWKEDSSFFLSNRLKFVLIWFHWDWFHIILWSLIKSRHTFETCVEFLHFKCRLTFQTSKLNAFRIYTNQFNLI